MPTTDLVRRAAIATACLLAIALPAPAAGLAASSDARLGVQPADTTLARLQAEIAALVAGFDGDAGVAAIHVESGRGIAASGERPFFLASVYKVPIRIIPRKVRTG